MLSASFAARFYRGTMQEYSLHKELARLEAMQPKAQIGVGLVDRNRVRLTNWTLLEDCLLDRWPGGAPRYLIPLGQVVLIEIQESSTEGAGATRS